MLSLFSFEKAGVGRASFYRNFTSKDDIVEKWISGITDDFLKESNINYQKDTARDFFVKLFTHLEKYKEYSSLIHKAGLTHLLKNEFDNKFLNIRKEGRPGYESYFLAGGIFNVYYYWLISGFHESPWELADTLVGLIQK